MIVRAVASPFSADSVCMMSGRKHHKSFRPSAHATRQSSGVSSASPRCFSFLMMCRLSSVFFAHCTCHRVCLSSPISQPPAIALFAANLHTRPFVSAGRVLCCTDRRKPHQTCVLARRQRLACPAPEPLAGKGARTAQRHPTRGAAWQCTAFGRGRSRLVQS